MRIHFDENKLCIQNTFHEVADELQNEHSFGLGLMLVRELCERLDWQIDLEVRAPWMEVEVEW